MECLDEERTGPFSNEGREDRLEIGFSDRSRDKNLSPDHARCLLHDGRIALRSSSRQRQARVHHQTIAVFRYHVPQITELRLGPSRLFE